MTAQYRLREDADEMERSAERLTRDIEDMEARLVDLRRKRDDMRFHRAEALAAAQALDGIRFQVTRDERGLVTVSIDPPVTDRNKP